MKQRTARIISYICMPTTFAFISFIILSNQTSYGRNEFAIAAVAVTFGAIIPFAYLYLLLHRKKVTEIDIPIRQQRTIPYLVSVAIYSFGFVILFILKASLPVYALMFCYATNTFVVSLINVRWKISAHAMGASGPLTVLAMTFGWIAAPAFLLVPVVSWARVELRAHTKAQVVAGALLGIILTAAQLAAFHELVGGI
ncbi:MAG TPA: hypothetical protein VIS48_08955 [Candidatus Kryptonia bacterium]